MNFEQELKEPSNDVEKGSSTSETSPEKILERVDEEQGQERETGLVLEEKREETSSDDDLESKVPA